MFAPLCPGERIAKILTMQFLPTALLTLRVVVAAGQTHLELTLFAQPTQSFFFYAVYSGRQLASAYAGWRMEELCQFVFESDPQNFRIKWPADNRGSCFLLLKRNVENSELYELQISRREKEIDTLATIKTQLNLWEINNTQKQLAAVEAQLLKAEKETFDLRPSKNKYQAFDQVYQSADSASYLTFAELKRLPNYEQEMRSPRKKIFVAPSQTYYVQPPNNSQLMLKECIIIDSEEQGPPGREKYKMEPFQAFLATGNNHCQQSVRIIEQDYMQGEAQHKNIGSAVLRTIGNGRQKVSQPDQKTVYINQEHSFTKQDYSKTADTVLSKIANLQISPQTYPNLDFSASQFLPRYCIHSQPKGLLVTKIAEEKSFYHIHHRYPLSMSIQQFKLITKTINCHDFTFGILGASALKQSRMLWPIQIIAYIGCTNHIMNGFAFQKIPALFAPGDQLTVQVHLAQRRIMFYRNGEFLGEETVGKDMAKECYVFYETSTQGNSVLFPVN